MAEPLTNPLFEDEKEFLEHQKQEYERALLGEVEDIKEKTQQIGKYVAIGAGVLGGVWLLSKALGGRKKSDAEEYEEYEHEFNERPSRTVRSLRRRHTTDADLLANDEFGFGKAPQQGYRGSGSAPAHERADLAPEVYHAPASRQEPDADPFQPLASNTAVPSLALNRYTQHDEETSSVASSALRAFLQSDTGKMLVAQATAVLMAVVAKKLNDYLPISKNPDLATSSAADADIKDIDFTYHHDDANAPHQPL